MSLFRFNQLFELGLIFFGDVCVPSSMFNRSLTPNPSLFSPEYIVIDGGYSTHLSKQVSQTMLGREVADTTQPTRTRWRQTRPEINQLQKQLKEAEYILATSIFQARQKLTSFAKATKRPVLSDELIKETSAGHTRRTEMRLGFLCNSAINGHQNPASQNNPGEINRTGAAGGSEITPGGFGGIGEITVSAQNQFAWHLSVELHMTMGGGSSIPLDTRAGGQDDVEVMSTDSSSSSSSDSQ
ncbi:mediator complex [Culex quinquefasciatus]|uniref:Mediator of RNA polymerase II transcription subunit 4 n=1 Tax=Culex quinquefasciatus TaxID=7176 RepID=B0X3G2_CULQU|nr:mediator complex [Culex quinquefasciatus]|eukprot:XP_001864184.1 mediator complex [Culex quinquefasciatus]